MFDDIVSFVIVDEYTPAVALDCLFAMRTLVAAETVASSIHQRYRAEEEERTWRSLDGVQDRGKMKVREV